MARSVAILAAVALALAGCGFGPGDPSPGTATLTVTRDYGSEVLAEARDENPPASETVIRFLDREAEITTRYGGGFVQSIDGIEGELVDGRSRDWFFYVNGIESEIGSAEAQVRGGDRIWWDYRDWTDAMRVPAVVGSWPEPFLQAAAGAEAQPVRVECAAPQATCGRAVEGLDDEGVDASVGEPGSEPVEAAPRMLVGPWSALRRDRAPSQLDDGPATSGVFARFAPNARGPGVRLVALDERAEPARELGPGAGLVAALRDGDSPPTWLVTGTDRAGVEAAVRLLDAEDLRNRYAVAVAQDVEIALPTESRG
jgi:Domain of unknown function (DUF4430)